MKKLLCILCMPAFSIGDDIVVAGESAAVSHDFSFAPYSSVEVIAYPGAK